MSSDTQTEDVQYKVTKNFKNDVLRWLEIDDKIREYQIQLKKIEKK